MFGSARRHQLETIRRTKKTVDKDGDAEMPDQPEPRDRPQTGFYREETGSTQSPDTESKASSTVSPMDYIPSTSNSMHYECAEDMPGPKMETISESIVNNAAIEYLAAVCEATTEPACEFYDFREPFDRFKTRSGTSMEAPTDGILQGRDPEIPDIFAIVEVKPRHRRHRSKPRILWQESAEFVAWINHESKHTPVAEFPR